MMALLTKEPPSETLLRRRKILADISAMQKETQTLDDEATRRRQAVKDAEAALETAKAELVQADKLARSHALQAGNRTTPLRRELLETASPELDEHIARLQADVERFAEYKQTQTSANGKGLIVHSNVPELDRHRGEVQQAVRQLNELKLVAMTDRELGRELKRITGSITPPDTTIREVRRK